MADIVLYGPPQSSYVRSARIVCIEKGAPHRLEPVQLGSPDHEKLHPWKRVPSMRHGDVELYETAAIMRYVDDAFDGPKLSPATPAARARMEQWISVINCYAYDSIVRNYALQYILPMFKNEKPDMQKVAAGVPKMERDLGLLDEAYGEQPWLAGETVSLADLLLAPIIQTVGMFPEGQAALAKNKNLGRAYDALSKRESFKTVHAGVFG
jgi:glutathione S-transferase